MPVVEALSSGDWCEVGPVGIRVLLGHGELDARAVRLPVPCVAVSHPADCQLFSSRNACSGNRACTDATGAKRGWRQGDVVLVCGLAESEVEGRRADITL